MREVDYPLLENGLLKKIYEIIPKEKITLNQELIKTINVPLGKECVVCKAELGDKIPHYWCKFTNEHLCVKCGEALDETK